MFMEADLVSMFSDHVVYLIHEGGNEEDPYRQEVWIPIDENGDYCGDGQVVTVSGEKPWRGTKSMFGKLLHDRRIRGEWPKRTGLQAG